MYQSVAALGAEQQQTAPISTGAPAPVRLGPASRSVAVSTWALSPRKRALDLILAVLSLLPLLLVTLAVALVSAAAFRAWPFFVQQRVGLDGKSFSVVKVRSLPKSWHADKGKHELEHEQMPRISRLLRSTHLDEIPQVFNVLLGQMSFVGPRPMIPGVLALLPSDIAKQRARVRPGVTGAWQISTMGGKPLHECAELDIAYVERASARGDLWLLWQTVATHLWAEALAPAAVSRRLTSMAGIVDDAG